MAAEDITKVDADISEVEGFLRELRERKAALQSDEVIWVQNTKTGAVDVATVHAWNTQLNGPNTGGIFRRLTPEESAEQERKAANALKERRARQARRGELLSGDTSRDLEALQAKVAELEASRRKSK